MSILGPLLEDPHSHYGLGQSSRGGEQNHCTIVGPNRSTPVGPGGSAGRVRDLYEYLPLPMVNCQSLLGYGASGLNTDACGP